MSEFDFKDFFSNLPATLAGSGVDLLGGIVRGGGLGGMADMLIPADIARNNPQIAGLVKQFAGPLLRKLNDEFIDTITGTGELDIPMSVFANSRGYAYNIYNRQRTLRGSDLRNLQKSIYDVDTASADLFGRNFAEVLGYVGNEDIVARNSVIGSMVKYIGASQLKEFQGIGRDIYANLMNDDAAMLGGELDKKTGRVVFDEAERNLAARGAVDLSKKLINSFYGTNGARKFGSLNINDVEALTEIAQTRTKSGELKSEEQTKQYNDRIVATVERLAASVDNVRDVLGRQVSAGEALKFLSQLSGSNVANMGSAAVAALSSDFRDVGIRNDLDQKQLIGLAASGYKYYSRFGINQGISTRLELDRLKAWGTGESQVVGYSDEDKVADQRRLMANRELYGLSENVRTAFAAYIGQTNKPITQKTFDDFLEKVGGVGALRSTADIARNLNSAFGFNLSTDAVERAATTTTARVIGRTIDTNSAAMLAIAKDLQRSATDVGKGLRNEGGYELLTADNLKKLGVGSIDELAGLSYAELSERFASAEDIPLGLRGQAEAARAAIYRRAGNSAGMSADQAEQILVSEGYRKRLTDGIDTSNRVRYATGMQGITQLFSDAARTGSEVSVAEIASVGLLGVGFGGDRNAVKKFYENVEKEHGKEAADKLESIKLSKEDNQYITAISKNAELTDAQKNRLIWERLDKVSSGALTAIGLVGEGKNRRYGMSAVDEVKNSKSTLDDDDALAAFLYGTGATNEHNLNGANKDLISKANKILLSDASTANKRTELLEIAKTMGGDHGSKLLERIESGELGATAAEKGSAILAMQESLKQLADDVRILRDAGTGAGINTKEKAPA